MKKTLLYSVTAGLALGLTTAHASLEILEQFDYTAGNLAGNGSGTLGLDANWTSSGGTNQQQVTGTGLSFTNLSTTGGAVNRPAVSQNDWAQVALTQTAKDNLLVDGSTIYFSLLVQGQTVSANNREFDNTTFYIGTSDTPGSGDKPVTSAGEGFGFAIDGTGSEELQFKGIAIDGGTTSLSGDLLDANVASDDDSVFMIAGEIKWAANGSSDELSLWNIVDPTNGLGTETISMTADLDQTLFDTLTIASRQAGTFDEIRFGTTWADVGIAIPEPSSYALLAGMLGLTCVMLRRRQG